MKKILVIDNSSGITGAFNSLYQVTNLLRSNFEFIYLIPKGSQNLSFLQQSKFRVKVLRFIEVSKSLNTILYIPNLIYNLIKITKYIKTTKVDLIHVNDLYNMLGIMVKLFNPKIKLVYHVRLLPNSYASKLYPIWKRTIIIFADEIICVSKAVAENFSTKKATLIYDSINSQNIVQFKKANSSNSNLNILYLANYTEGKGHKQAIDAYKKAFPLLKNTNFIFWGGTLNKQKNIRYKISLIQYSQELGLSNSIVFNGFCSNPDEEITKADLMLNFSESESFSMTTLEALAYGTPIIATDCGGPSEIIEDGISGIIVPVNDIEAMSSSIITLVNDEQLRTSLSQNGVNRVKLKFNLTNQANKLNTLYTRLLNEH